MSSSIHYCLANGVVLTRGALQFVQTKQFHYGFFVSGERGKTSIWSNFLPLSIKKEKVGHLGQKKQENIADVTSLCLTGQCTQRLCRAGQGISDNESSSLQTFPPKYRSFFRPLSFWVVFCSLSLSHANNKGQRTEKWKTKTSKIKQLDIRDI